MNLALGMKGTASTLVEREDTALEVGSGSLLVYATPCMVALMEGAACEAIAPGLEEGETSVGIELNIRHTAATPVGMEVRAEAELSAVDGKILSFEIHAFDESEKQQRAPKRMLDTNDLKIVRPPVLLDEIPWYQMDMDGDGKFEDFQLYEATNDPQTATIKDNNTVLTFYYVRCTQTMTIKKQRAIMTHFRSGFCI